MAVVAGFAGLEGVDLTAVDLVDDARRAWEARRLSKVIYFVASRTNASSWWGTLSPIQTELTCVFSMY